MKTILRKTLLTYHAPNYRMVLCIAYYDKPLYQILINRKIYRSSTDYAWIVKMFTNKVLTHSLLLNPDSFKLYD